jgi:hypothetical protein
VVVRNPFKQQNGENWNKNLKGKKSSTAGKHFAGELHIWEYLT